MKRKIQSILFLILTIVSLNNCYAQEQSIDEQKKEIIAVYNSNNIVEAYNMISKIMEEDRDYELWYILANISQDMNNEENAIFFLEKSIILKPDFDKAHYNLGNIYLKNNKYNSAINEYKLAIKYKKDYAFYYYNLGCAYYKQEEYKYARTALKKAISLKNNEPSFYYNLALVNKKLDRIKDAQEALDKYNELTREENL